MGEKTAAMTMITVHVERLPERGDDGDGEEDERDREQCVDDAADRVVGDPLEVAGDQPECRADERREQRRERRDEKDVPRAGQDPGEDVTSEAVRTEEVLRDGAAPISGVWSNRGSYGVMWSPRTAHTTQKRMTVAPTMKLGLVTSSA